MVWVPFHIGGKHRKGKYASCKTAASYQRLPPKQSRNR
jgi:hypothetical protein